jgi:hypothetical protein
MKKTYLLLSLVATGMQGFARYNEYDALMSEWLLKKWRLMLK